MRTSLVTTLNKLPLDLKAMSHWRLARNINGNTLETAEAEHYNRISH